MLKGFGWERCQPPREPMSWWDPVGAPPDTCAAPPLAIPCADSFPFKWINKKWKEGFFGARQQELRLGLGLAAAVCRHNES